MSAWAGPDWPPDSEVTTTLGTLGGHNSQQPIQANTTKDEDECLLSAV